MRAFLCFTVVLSLTQECPLVRAETSKLDRGV